MISPVKRNAKQMATPKPDKANEAASAQAPEAPEASRPAHQGLIKSTTGQGISYLLVGGGTALLELVLFHLLNSIFGVHAAISNIIAVVVATATNFALNGTVTFAGAPNLRRSLVRYVILFLANTAFSTCIVTLAANAGFYPTIAKLFTMACIVIWNFFLYKKWVFA